MGGKRRWLIGLLIVLLVSCVTVNIYFPAAAIQKAADQIVDDVRKTPEPKPARNPNRSRISPACWIESWWSDSDRPRRRRRRWM